MRIKGLVDEDFVNYKLPSMFISTCSCDWKCCTEANIPIETCQNCALAQSETYEISVEELYQRYIDNPISESIVIGGLEPAKQMNEVNDLVEYFRNNGCDDDIVIYTGYYEDEIASWITYLNQFPNIVFKFGRYVPDNESHYDKVIGVNLVSDNQYGKRIS